MLGGKNFSVPVTVVDDITADIILGIDFLRTENCVVDLGWKTLQLPSRKTLQSLHTDKQHVSLDKVQQGQLFVVLQQHRCAFAAGPGDCGRTNRVRHRIHTPNSAPVCQAPHRLPVGLRDEARQALMDMLERRVVPPSKSPWSSPVVLVQKRGGSVRFCVDYRQVNALTTKDTTPCHALTRPLTPCRKQSGSAPWI